MELTERIAQLLEEKFTTDPDFGDCYTIEIELKPGQRLLVFIDSDSGMSFDKCQKISRYLESFIDANDWLGSKYVLEVSSPGINRPLKFLRQYLKNIGRTVAVTLLDHSQQIGTLQAADEHQLVLTQKVIEREGKKKKEVILERAIPFDQIEKTIVKAVI